MLPRTRTFIGWTLLLGMATIVSDRAAAFISQADGTVVPETARLQMCLDRPGTGETTPGAVDAIDDANVLPEVYRPVLDATSGNYRVTFVDIGEGAGFRNSFGWFWVDEDPTDPANLHTVFGCRTYGTCNCPCATTRTVVIDFDLEPGFSPGRGIGFWLRSPENLDGTRESGTYDTGLPYCTPEVGCDPTVANLDDSCGGRLDTNNRIYFTSQALNDDGDYVHFLVYESATRADTYYFGFEDLFRGGDNDFEDMMVRASGLVPLCTPTVETCDNTDEDCDLAIDEGLTQACSTACGAGVRTCDAGSFGACSAPTPAGESCNNLDDDCDGSIDEGLTRSCTGMCPGTGTEICREGSFVDCSAPSPTLEICNNNDDDCDGPVDEGITRACSTLCGSGVETCSAGSFAGCTAPTPTGESCNGIDDDCDGRADEGITRPCSTDCGAGIETCIGGVFAGCTAPAPTLEACNNLDDDCDGPVDEGITRACSTACGVGSERCEMGSFVDCDAPTASPEICNNIDDNCNGVIDDGNPGGGDPCLPNTDGSFTVVAPGTMGMDGLCIPGEVRCIGGTLTCVGASSPTREICNCEDDDCDGNIDEEAGGGLCPGGACVGCMCASPCSDGEFPCPPGRQCDRTLASPGIVGFCIPGRCNGVMCTDEELCDPDNGECVNVCSDVTCADGQTCLRGACVENTCYGTGCPVGERCRNGACEADPCLDVSCGEREFCRDGECIDSCETACDAREICINGECVDSPCSAICSTGESCVEGECISNQCDPACGRARVCVGTECVDDPCQGVRCPAGTLCVDGQCSNQTPTTPAADPSYGVAAGGGGCQCQTARGQTGSLWWSLGLMLLVVLRNLILGRRRRAPRATRIRARGTGFVVLLSLLGAGCDAEPFCFDNCEETPDASALSDAGLPDAMIQDGCVPQGPETCNGQDDDCNGIVDDGFDLARDPRNCGECGVECALPSAFPTCELGECVIDSCEIGFVNLNDVPGDGCEYACQPSGSEICDGRDNDCDGSTDEGFDQTSDLAHCGRCGNVCGFPNAAARCEASACTMGACNVGFVDANSDPADGCEYACTPGGSESCNGVDDDCDRQIDEGFDLTTNTAHCGVCGRACAFLNANGACVDSLCGIASCQSGFVDLDDNPATGCEYPCTATSPDGICDAGEACADACDGTDNDCDGAIDEGDPVSGTACGSSTGECTLGTWVCQLGGFQCVGGLSPTPETCDGLDNNCNGTPDDGVLPGEGDRCGSTNVGACEFGMNECTGGSLACAGTFQGPTTEVCNGVDDDCNGAADDGLTPPAPGSPLFPATCALTDGVCAGRVPVCSGGAWGCDFPDTYQSTEALCDGLDNDCDGTMDEGCLSPAPSTERRVDRGDADGAANSIRVEVSGNGSDRVYATWMDLRNGDAQAFFSRFLVGSTDWVSPVRLDTESGSGHGPVINPQIAANGSDLAVVWSDFRSGDSYREVWGRASTDSGASFGAGDQQVSGATTDDSFGIDLAVSGSVVWAVWEAFVTERSRQIFAARSSDGGATWGTPVQVSHGTGTTFVAATAQVAATGTAAYAVWRDNRNGGFDIYLNRLSATGVNDVTVSATDQRIDTGDTPGSGASFTPQIAVNGPNVYAVWVDDRPSGSLDIWLNRSSNGGATWLSSATRLDDDPIDHDSIEPQVVALPSGIVVVAWVDYRSGFPDIVARQSGTGGATFGEVQRLDTSTGPGTSSSFDLSMAASGNLVVAAWADDRTGFFDVHANYSLDAGTSFQPDDIRLNQRSMASMYDSEDPAVYVSSTSGHVVWVDHRGGANGDLYYRSLAP